MRPWLSTKLLAPRTSTTLYLGGELKDRTTGCLSLGVPDSEVDLAVIISSELCRTPLVWISCQGRLGLGLLAGCGKVFSGLPHRKI